MNILGTEAGALTSTARFVVNKLHLAETGENRDIQGRAMQQQTKIRHISCLAPAAGLLACILLPAWQPAQASPVQVLECEMISLLGPLPFDSVDTRFTIRRHIRHVEPYETIETGLWSQGKFQENGELQVTVYPFEGPPQVELAASTRTTLLDGNEAESFQDQYLDEAPTMEKTIVHDGYTLESVSISLKKAGGTAIDTHLAVPPVVDRAAWNPWECARCNNECVVTWHAPGDGVECALGNSGGTICTTGSYFGRITSLSLEDHEEEHGDGFEFNAGLNDAWVNASAPYQGLFVTVYPDQGIVFVAWFTYDSELPPPDAMASFGAPDQRWVTAVGSYSGNRAELNAELTTGGVFNASEPVPVQDTGFGSMVLEFSDCGNGTLTYDFPSLGLSGEFAIERVEPGNATLCEALGAD
jgi:hypothetical protein